MKKIAIINDLHFGEKNDSPVMFIHQKKFLDQFFQYVIDNDIKHIFIPGDVFHRRKYINFLTLSRTKEIFLDRLQELVIEYGVEVNISLGNHDIYYRELIDPNSLELILQDYDFNLFTKPETVRVNGHDILLLPWICESNYKQCIDAINNTKAKICLAHLELLGFEFSRGIVATHGLDHGLFSRFSWVGTGHYHTRSVRDNIHYLGSAFEFTWIDCEDAKGFTIFDLDTLEETFIQNHFYIHRKIVYDDTDQKQMKKIIEETDFSQYKNCFVRIVIKKKTNNSLFETLIEQLIKGSPEKYTIDNEEMIAENPNMNFDNIKTTTDIIKKYVDNSSYDNKVAIERELLSLYTEAVLIENVE